MDFRDRTTTRKGSLGEQIGDRILLADGWIPYSPPSMAHPIDRIVMRRGNLQAFACDMKAKPKRTQYNDTGIDQACRDEYLELCHTQDLDCLLVFIDEDMRKAYYGFLRDLEKHRRAADVKGRMLDYPRTEWCLNRATGIICEIRFYPLIALRGHVDLTPEECRRLNLLSTRDPKYAAAAANRADQKTLF